MRDLSQWGPNLLARMKTLPGLQDVNSDQQNDGLDQFLTYDRVTAARLGITPQSLDSTLYSAFGQSQVSIIYTQLNQYYVVLEVAPQYWQRPGRPEIHLPAHVEQWCHPLDAVTHAQTGTTPLTVNHTGLFLGHGIFQSRARHFFERCGRRRSPGCTESGHAPHDPRVLRRHLLAYQQSLSSEPYLILTALLAVYIVLGILYESLVHPLTIISTLPSASAGAMLALMLFKVDLSVISIIGIVLLIGIVKKNAIMMIDFALVAERERRHEHQGRDI